MNSHLISKIKARDAFFDLWKELGQGIANDPEQWGDWQQAMGRADSELAQQLAAVMTAMQQAEHDAALAGF